MKRYLTSVIKQFEYYRGLGDKTLEQLSFEDLMNDVATDANSIAIIVKHLTGNMLSRWTNFLTEDGEKIWRQRDQEFQANFKTKNDVITTWNKGWDCLFKTLNSLDKNHLDQLVYIRNEGHTVTEAINRQMMHYAYHVGQIVYLGKLLKGDQWQSLSISKGESHIYNKQKFDLDKTIKHFTDDV